MTDNGFWINRIVETGAADPQELARGFNPLNWRGHPESQREALEEALDSIGILQRVLVNRRSGRVIDGHLRIELAVLKGQPLIPVDYVELTDDEEALALATLDAITEQAEPIADKLAALLERTREMTADKPGLAGMLEALRQRAGVNGNGHAPKDAEPQIDKAAQLKEQWGTKLGQVWEMPSQVDGRPHRIVCGDCTDRAVVEAVMRGERADIVITSPPYNSNSELHGSDNFRGKLYLNKSVDVMSQEDYLELNRLVFLCFAEFVHDNGNIFYNLSYNRNSRSEYILIISNAIQDGFRLHETIVWKKTGMPNPASVDVMTRDFEFVFLLNRFDTYRTSKASGEVRSNFWQINNTGVQLPEHKACFPVGLPERAIIETSSGVDIVLDSFLGSGTTLIAAHNLHRIARGIEIDPGYVAVTLERYQQAFGIQPRLLTG